MIKAEINRLWHGLASVRSNIVNVAIKEREDLLIVLKDRSGAMLVPYDELRNGKENAKLFFSKYDNQPYRLVDYEWKPTSQQIELL